MLQHPLIAQTVETVVAGGGIVSYDTGIGGGRHSLRQRPARRPARSFR